uniref:Iodothyronine deiodinase n=3 Tax=Erpetoichthys calabaricus TaxID=27687 RepID=A0A8C4S4X1_ERPCA
MGKWTVRFKYVLTFILLLLQLLVFRLIALICPGIAKNILLKLGELSTMTQNPKFSFEDWGPTFFTLTFVKSVFFETLANCGDEAVEGEAAPNTTVLDLQGGLHKLHEFMREDRPLVLNFGSCS